MPTDTFCSDAFYVHTDPSSLPSFAEECSFGNCLRIHTTKKICKGWVAQTSTCVSGARHADFPDADLAEVGDESDFVCPVWNVPEALGWTDCLLLRSHQ